MEQLSLFGDLEPDKKEIEEPNKAPVTESNIPKIASSLASHYESILNWIKDGYTVKQMCEHLIKHKGLSSETYSQGTPKIYPKLMIYLTHLQKDQLVKLTKVDPVGHGDFVDYNEQYVGRKCDAIFMLVEE